MKMCFVRCRFESHTVLRNIGPTHTGPEFPSLKSSSIQELERSIRLVSSLMYNILRHATNFKSNAFLLFSLAKLISQVEDVNLGRMRTCDVTCSP